MPSGEEEEIAAPGRLPAFFNAGAARAFLVFLAFFTNLQSHSGSTYRHDDHGPSLQPLARFGRGFARTQKQRHKQALIDSPRFKAKFPAHAGEFFAEAQIGCLGRERLWARPPDRALAPCWSPSLRGKSRPMRVTSFARSVPSRVNRRTCQMRSGGGPLW